MLVYTNKLVDLQITLESVPKTIQYQVMTSKSRLTTSTDYESDVLPTAPRRTNLLDSVIVNQYFQLMPIYILHNTNIQQQYTYTRTNAASHLCKTRIIEM